MENSNPQSLAATESFSYGWLTNQEQPIFHDNSIPKEHNFNFDIPFHDAIVHADEIFYDGHILPFYAERSHVDHDDVAFGIPSTSFLGRSQSEEACISYAESPTCSYLDQETQFSPRQSLDCPGTRFFNQKESGSDAKHLSRSLSTKLTEVYVLGKWRRSSKRILQKCFGFVKPLLVGSRKSIRVDDLERKVCEIQTCSNSAQASPRPSSAYSVVEWADVKKLGKKIDLDLGIKRVKSWNTSSHQGSPRVSLPRSSSSCYDVESSIHEAVLYCKRSIIEK